LPWQQASSLPSQQSVLATAATTLPTLHSASLPSQQEAPLAATVIALLSQHELLAATALLSQQEVLAATALPSPVRTQQPFWPQHLHVQVSHGQTPVSMQQVPSTQQGPQSLDDIVVNAGVVFFETLKPVKLAAPAMAATAPTRATNAKTFEKFFIVVFL
jgi:hypothetical protein